MGEYETLLYFKVSANYTHTLWDPMYHQAKRNMFQSHEMSMTAFVLHGKKIHGILVQLSGISTAVEPVSKILLFNALLLSSGTSCLEVAA